MIAPDHIEVHTGGGFMSLAGPLISLLLGATLFGCITRVAIPPAAWVAFILLLHATRTMPPVMGLLSVGIALYIALAIGNRGVIPIGGPAYFAVVAAIAVTVLVPFVLDRAALSRLDGVRFTLIFPAAFVALEFLRSRSPSAASWGSIAYTQYGLLPIMQIAALAGIWGITFAITWTASTLEFAWRHGFDSTSARIPVIACFGLVTALALAGAIRVAFASTAIPSLRAATLNRPIDLFIPGEMTRITEGRVSADELPQVKEKLTRLQEWFFDGSRREARAGARLIAWPEANLLVFRDDEPAFLERARRVASEEHVYLAIGMASVQRGEPLPVENRSVLIDPSGQIIINYLKTHAVAGWEAGLIKRGDGRLASVPTPAGRIATAICFDADFPEFMRQAGEQRADLLIVPANDWKEVKSTHVQMAAFRAIENGVPIVRAAASGISSAFDQWGRVLAVGDYFAPGDRTMTAQVPIGGVWTLYPRIGDLFAWCCVAAVAVLTIIATLHRAV